MRRAASTWPRPARCPPAGVERHVAGRVVEGDEVGEALAHERDVGDAADVLERAPHARLAEEQVVDERHEGRAFAARGDVAHAEVAHDGAARALGDDGRLADLHRRAEPARRARVVDGGLAVRADEVDVLDAHARDAADLERRLGEGLSEQDVEVAQLARVRLREAEDALAQRTPERDRQEGARDEARGLSAAFDLAQRGVRAVGARARQEADDAPARPPAQIVEALQGIDGRAHG